MSLARPHHSEGGPFRGDSKFSIGRHYSTFNNNAPTTAKKYYNNDNNIRNHGNSHEFSRKMSETSNYYDHVMPEVYPSSKRRKFSSSTWENSVRPYNQSRTYQTAPTTCSKNISLPHATTEDSSAYTSASCKRDRAKFEDEEVVFMSRDEIERCSPSRKDGIDAAHETHLRYSYCAFLQNLGVTLEIPQTTIGSAMVLCHRFFVRRSHASHDRFLIATAALFLATKSEETPCPLNNVLRAACEILHKQDFNMLCYLLSLNWFEQYRERVIEAEQLILTTLNFELNVQHPYAPLTSILEKLGLAQSFLVHLALSLVSEGFYVQIQWPVLIRSLVLDCLVSQLNEGRLRSSLWLQFKPHQIAAGAAYLAAKSLNMDISSCQNVWQEFHTPPSVLKDVVQQFMELF